jgi:Sulfatase
MLKPAARRDRATFITGEIPLRTGLTTVGQTGADVGTPTQAYTIATALKAQGYLTAQFDKNHLGYLNKYLPTLHGFDDIALQMILRERTSSRQTKTYRSGCRNQLPSWAAPCDASASANRFGRSEIITRALFSATTIGALMLGGASGTLAEEFPTFERNGFPITPPQVRVLGSDEVQDRAPSSRLTDGMPAFQHQLRALRQDGHATQ